LSRSDLFVVFADIIWLLYFYKIVYVEGVYGVDLNLIHNKLLNKIKTRYMLSNTLSRVSAKKSSAVLRPGLSLPPVMIVAQQMPTEHVLAELANVKTVTSVVVRLALYHHIAEGYNRKVTTNSEIHKYLEMNTVKEEILFATKVYKERLIRHLNELAVKLTTGDYGTRLKRKDILTD
jgi:hypothetical protein